MFRNLKKLAEYLDDMGWKEEAEAVGCLGDFSEGKISRGEFLLLQKTAKDSDEVYLELIRQIIYLFKYHSMEIESGLERKIYRIDLRDLNFYDYMVLYPNALGDYLDLWIYHPRADDRPEEYKKFYGLYSPPFSGANPRILFFPNEEQWESFGRDGNFLQSFIRASEGVLKHEITHFLNNTRFVSPKNIEAISKYEKQNTGDGSFGYVNSTEEIQARIIPIISFILDGIFHDKSKNLYDLYHEKWLPIYKNKNGTKREIFLATILYYVVNNDINSFINHIFKQSSTLYLDDPNLLEKTKRRYLKRLYDLFIFIKDKFQNTETIS